jgi:hypothetical protein
MKLEEKSLSTFNFLALLRQGFEGQPTHFYESGFSSILANPLKSWPCQP